MPPLDKPNWWGWELDMTLPHLRKRMMDRGFNDTDVRSLLESVTELQPNHEPGRWVARGRLRFSTWEVVLEPLYNEQIVLVITAYKVL